MKNYEKSLIFEIIAFEYVTGNLPYCEENTCH